MKRRTNVLLSPNATWAPRRPLEAKCGNDTGAPFNEMQLRFCQAPVPGQRAERKPERRERRAMEHGFS